MRDLAAGPGSRHILQFYAKVPGAFTYCGRRQRFFTPRACGGESSRGNDGCRSTGSAGFNDLRIGAGLRRFISEEHTSELQSLMRISYAVFCLKKKKIQHTIMNTNITKYI